MPEVVLIIGTLSGLGETITAWPGGAISSTVRPQQALEFMTPSIRSCGEFPTSSLKSSQNCSKKMPRTV